MGAHEPINEPACHMPASSTESSKWGSKSAEEPLRTKALPMADARALEVTSTKQNSAMETSRSHQSLLKGSTALGVPLDAGTCGGRAVFIHQRLSPQGTDSNCLQEVTSNRKAGGLWLPCETVEVRGPWE